MRPLPQKPINSSSFYAIPSHLCRWRSNLSVGATFLSIKQVSLHTTMVPHFSSSLSPLHTHNFSHFTSFSVHFCPKGRNHSTITNLPSSAPHLENQYRRHSSRNSTSVLLQGFLLINSMFIHDLYFYVKSFVNMNCN